MRLGLEPQISVDFIFHPGSLSFIIGIGNNFQQPAESFRLWHGFRAEVNHHVGWIQVGKHTNMNWCLVGILVTGPGMWQKPAFGILPHQRIQLLTGSFRSCDYEGFLLSFPGHQCQAAGQFVCLRCLFTQQVEVNLARLGMGDFVRHG